MADRRIGAVVQWCHGEVVNFFLQINRTFDYYLKRTDF